MAIQDGIKSEVDMSSDTGGATMNPDELSRAYEELREEHRTKGGLTYRERRACLKALLKSVRSRKEEIGEAVSQDFGCRSTDETYGAEIYLVVAGIKHALAEMREWMAPQDRTVGWPWLPASAKLVSQPLGVVGVIAPWNYPVGTALGPVVAALSAGNRVLVKPSEETPKTSALLKDLLEGSVGKDVARVTPGGLDVGRAFASLPLDHLLFTGSTAVGRRVMEAASRNLTPVTLELGGKSPAFVHPSYSPTSAAARIAFGKLFNAGQTCLAPDYALVHEDKVDAFVDAFVKAARGYYPTIRDNPDYTSIVNSRHYGRIQGLLDGAAESGAKIVAVLPAGEDLAPEGRKIAPTLVLGASREMAIMQEEIFGPVLPVIPYKDVDEAIQFINGADRPLAIYYFDHKGSRGEDMIARTMSGGVCLNETLMHYAQEGLPFGGVGASGMGAYHGHAGFRTFSHERAVFKQARVNAMAILDPPHGGLGRTLVRWLIG